VIEADQDGAAVCDTVPNWRMRSRRLPAALNAAMPRKANLLRLRRACFELAPVICSGSPGGIQMMGGNAGKKQFTTLLSPAATLGVGNAPRASRTSRLKIHPYYQVAGNFRRREARAVEWSDCWILAPLAALIPALLSSDLLSVLSTSTKAGWRLPPGWPH